MITPAQFSEQLAGIQLAVFEIVWSAIPTLTSIHIHIRNRRAELYCVAEPPLSKKDRDECQRLLTEIMAVALPDATTVVKFEATRPARALEVMSPQIFRTIAEDVAPWRLKEGR